MQIFNKMNKFYFYLLACGIIFSIILLTVAVYLFATTTYSSGSYRLAENLCSAAQKTLILSTFVSVIGDIVTKSQKQKKN